jgi:hypothetical protein
MRSTPLRWSACGLLLFALFFAISFRLLGRQTQTDPDLNAHEWGTFTSVAGSDGKALKWLPLNGSADLPNFVETFQKTKAALFGTIRMETPVLYFYSSRETTLSVKVSFSKGLITEWYPHARVSPAGTSEDVIAYQKKPGTGSISWDSVNLVPNLKADLLRDSRGGDRYYAARETSSALLRVETPQGSQQEKFLFYRGVSAMDVPISAKLKPQGKVLITNADHDEVPNVILFERRGDKLGYRIGGPLQGEMTMDRPELTDTVDALNNELETILLGQGLFADEAHAMVETWRNSWSEEGSRLFYIVPPGFVNRMLPLSIRPAPGQSTRVFVGRMELITPETERAVETAFLTHDNAAIGNYVRFIYPILKVIGEHESDPAKAMQIKVFLGQFYDSRTAR